MLTQEFERLNAYDKPTPTRHGTQSRGRISELAAEKCDGDGPSPANSSHEQ
jgi:hypothetical protein